jgi:hypothetical protein
MTELERFLITAVITVITVIVGWLINYFSVIVKIKEDIADLKAVVNLFRKGLESKVADMLKSYPSNLGKDVLLEKYKLGELNLDEAETLRTILIEELKSNTNPPKEAVYALALATLEPLIYDLRKRRIK